jgi:hypothetical protein
MILEGGNDMLLACACREQNRYNKKAAAGVLRAIAKHSAPLAQAVVDSGAIPPLIMCLEEFDPSVKEVAAGALDNIARHTPQLAQVVVDAGAVSLLVLAVQVHLTLSPSHCTWWIDFCTCCCACPHIVKKHVQLKIIEMYSWLFALYVRDSSLESKLSFSTLKPHLHQQ